MSSSHKNENDNTIFPMLMPPGYSASIEKSELELDLQESGVGFINMMW